MLRFILRRLLVAIPTLLVVVTAAFFMMRLAPGSPFLNERQLPAEILKNVEAKYGFDRPLVEQYVRYVGDVVRGDFGPSLKYKGKTVVDFIKEGLPTSALIGGMSLLIASLVGIALGILAALRQNRPADYGAMALAILGVCIPTFVTAPLLVMVFASKLGWLPTAGVTGGAKPCPRSPSSRAWCAPA